MEFFRGESKDLKVLEKWLADIETAFNASDGESDSLEAIFKVKQPQRK